MRLLDSRASRITGFILVILHTLIFVSSWYGGYQAHEQYISSADKAGTFCWGCSLAWLPVQIIDLPSGYLIEVVNRFVAYFVYAPGYRHFNVIYLGIDNVFGTSIFFLVGTLQWLLIGALIGILIQKIRSLKRS